MINLLIVGIALGVLVTIHEGGHFLAAKLMGVYVEKFSIGFGPKLVGFKKWGTDFRISLIPLGGYVKMKAENPNEEASGDDDEFQSKKWYQRAFIAFAGPFANLLLAFLLFIISFWIGRNYEDHLPVIGEIVNEQSSPFKIKDKILEVNGEKIKGWSQISVNTKENSINKILVNRSDSLITLQVSEINQMSWYEDFLPLAPPIIGDVAPGMAAYSAGLQENDIVIAIDSKEINSWYEMRELIVDCEKDNILFTIERDNKIFEKDIKLQTNVMDTNRKMIGITQKMPIEYSEKYSFIEGIRYGFITGVNFTISNYVVMYKLLAKPSTLKDSVGGPVMLLSMSNQTTKKGIDAVLSLFAAISIMLMMVNLLPIPILDGGQIFFFFWEGISRKPISMKVQMILQQVGFSLLIALMIFTFYSDFSKLFRRNLSLKKQQEVMDKNQEKDQNLP